jgi:hypothetical protein
MAALAADLGVRRTPVGSMRDDQAALGYDYSRRERRFRESLAAFVGLHLTAMRIQVLHGELNQVFLGLDERLVSIHGDIGGELLKVVDVPALPDLGVVDEDSRIWQPPQAAKLIGHAVAAARAVGEAWNGHGMELAFEGLPTETILITSVETPENKSDVHDMIRVAFPTYVMEIPPEEADA